MKKGDLITIALLMVSVIGIALIMANLQFDPAPPGPANKTVKPIQVSKVSPTPSPTTISFTLRPSPTIVLAVNKDNTLLNAPIGEGTPPVINKTPSPTVEPTPKPKVKAANARAIRTVPTVRPSTTKAIKNNAAKGHGHDDQD